mmetsp:Transcript_8279/g.27872  ORF Transcript_8279/g.27872 Transcript_8279/m.27872 type:complete len:127 (-) Transcript_8279:481-861(-)
MVAARHPSVHPKSSLLTCSQIHFCFLPFVLSRFSPSHSPNLILIRPPFLPHKSNKQHITEKSSLCIPNSVLVYMLQCPFIFLYLRKCKFYPNLLFCKQIFYMIATRVKTALPTCPLCPNIQCFKKS